MEKFDLLYSVLSSLHKAGVLADCVLVGSWCQDFYRHLWGNPFQIPAATTTDADLLVPKRLKFKLSADIASIMQENGFKIVIHRNGLMKFIHEDFTFEFLTEAGAKADEEVFTFKNLNLTAQELHFMNIPVAYNFVIPFRDISIRLPEPEAFALHKLIVSQRRRKVEKREKDLAAASGLFDYFATKEKHRKRLKEILDEFPRGWRKRIDEALKKSGLELPQ
jgi:hypothetical protein